MLQNHEQFTTILEVILGLSGSIYGVPQALKALPNIPLKGNHRYSPELGTREVQLLGLRLTDSMRSIWMGPLARENYNTFFYNPS